MATPDPQLDQLLSTIANVPGIAEQGALVMLVDLNLRMHQDLVRLQEEVRVLKSSPSVQCAERLEAQLLAKLREKVAAGGRWQVTMMFYKESFHRSPANDTEYGVYGRFTMSQELMGIRGTWSRGGTIPFALPGSYDSQNLDDKQHVRWFSLEELEPAARKLVRGANGWRLSYIVCDGEQLYVAFDVP